MITVTVANVENVYTTGTDTGWNQDLAISTYITESIYNTEPDVPYLTTTSSIIVQTNFFLRRSCCAPAEKQEVELPVLPDLTWKKRFRVAEVKPVLFSSHHRPMFHRKMMFSKSGWLNKKGKQKRRGH